MNTIASSLSASEIGAIADYYAHANAPPASYSSDLPKVWAGGLYSGETPLPTTRKTCARCHGAGGRVRRNGVPYLAGLNLAYLNRQVLDWVNGHRGDDDHHAELVVEIGEKQAAAVNRMFAASQSPGPPNPPPSSKPEATSAVPPPASSGPPGAQAEQTASPPASTPSHPAGATNAAMQAHVRVDRALIREVQRALTHRGLYHDGLDGIAGPLTREALRQFQKHHGLPITGHINHKTLDALRANGK